jgi:predicted dienelactone hydrolase
VRLAALIFAGFALLLAPALAATANVGFEEVKIANGTEPPLTAGIWYPTDAPAAAHALGPFTQTVAPGASIVGQGLPLVELSHGGGGSYKDRYDTALALAHAGFVAAAVSHAGDTYKDQSQVLRFWRRSAQLRRLVTYMLHEWPQHGRLDGSRVGALGFSNGGFAVLVAAGGVPDLSRAGPYCQSHPQHDLCRALTQGGVNPWHLGSDAPADAWTPDPRVRAAVIAAPAFGFAFGRAGLKNVRIPIQLWRAADDTHQPNPWYDEAVRLALPQAPEYHVVPGAGHFDFLPPCGPRLASRAPLICSDRLGFDRAAFLTEFNRDIVTFFRRSLG